MYSIRWHSHAVKKRGEEVAFQGRKSCKTTNNLVICDNKYHILAISDCIAGNHNDSFELIENMEVLVDTLKQAEIDFNKSHLNADAGFDTKEFIQTIESQYQMIANIPKNKRNQKKIEQEYRYLSDYIYSFRKKIETVFAWLDSYKRILVRFEYKARNFKAWLFLASALINLRTRLN
ncbi:MAG: transposase [Cytophagales bacterium]